MKRQPKPINNNGSIQLRFEIDGTVHLLSGYGKYDDPKALAVANSYASKLYSDYLTGNLKDLGDYKPKPLEVAIATTETNLYMLVYYLYGKYWVYKLPKLSHKTSQTYTLVSKLLNKCKVEDLALTNKHGIKRGITTGTTNYQAKLVCQHLEAASKWAYSNGLIDKHYLDLLGHDLPSGRSKPEPKPFTKQQRDDILDGFLNSRYYNAYRSFVWFLFNTGCRPCEAIGLQWDCVDFDKKQIKLGRSIVDLQDGSKQIRDDSKMGNQRYFPMSPQLAAWLRTYGTYRTDLVFSTPKYGTISLNNFRQRAWARVLGDLGIDPHEYTPYSCRDTFITMALEQGRDIREIAALCDNSPQVITKHYAGFTKAIKPVEFQ